MRLPIIAAVFAAAIALCGGRQAVACDPTFTTYHGRVVHVVQGMPAGSCDLTLQETLRTMDCYSPGNPFGYDGAARVEYASRKVDARYRRQYHLSPDAKVWHVVCQIWVNGRWIDPPKFQGQRR